MISFLILSGRSFYFHATATGPRRRPPPHARPSPRLAPTPTPSVHQTGICHRHRHTPPRHRRRAEKQYRNEVK